MKIDMTFKKQLMSLLGLFSIALSVIASDIDYTVLTVSKEEDVSQTKKSTPVPVYRKIEYSQIAPVAYDFNYEVHDEHTGDFKSQKEVRNGDVVQGRYELIDSDGFRRIVEYTADNHSGFNAIVRREPVDIKIPQPIPQDSKLGYTASITKDIPFQARPENRDIVYIVPKSSTQPKKLRYYVTPTYATTSHSSSNAGVSVPSAPAYSSLVHSDALSNSEHLGYSSQIPLREYPVYATHLDPFAAYNGQVYSERPSQNTRIALVPRHKTISHSTPAPNIYDYTTPLRHAQVYHGTRQNHVIPLDHAHVSHGAGQNEGYFNAPEIQSGSAIPAVGNYPYSRPDFGRQTIYGQFTKAHSKHYAADLVNAVSTATGFTPINSVEHVPSKLVAPSLVYPTQPSLVSSVAPQLETTLSSHRSIVSDVHSNDEVESKSTYSLQEGGSYDSYDAPTTPSYKH